MSNESVRHNTRDQVLSDAPHRMIPLFNGRRRSLDQSDDDLYVQLSVHMRKHLHLFNNGFGNLTSWAVFTVLFLHTNMDGWSWPGTQQATDELGIKTDVAFHSAVKVLRGIQIDGHPILHHYRAKRSDGKYGESYYHIFPDAGGAGSRPVENLVRWEPEAPSSKSSCR